MTENPALPARSTQEWRALDAAHALHPFTDYKALATEGSRIITRADGAWLWDSEGQRKLDGMAGLWCVNVGYGRADLADAAARQMRELPYYNLFFKTDDAAGHRAGTASWPRSHRPGLNHAFFTNSGSEANDTIIRLVRQFWGLRATPNGASSSDAATAITAPPWPPPWAG